MQLAKTVRGLLAASLLALSATASQAAVIYAGQYTYLGAFVPFPGAPFGEFFGRGPIGAGLIDDYWLFTVSAPAQGFGSANYTPDLPLITGWDGGFYNVDAAACGAAGTVCAGVTIGSQIVDFTTVGGLNTSGNAPFAPGVYAIHLTGTNTVAQRIYSGQVVFFAQPVEVPEPDSLALFGIALAGLGFLRRRKPR